MNTSLYHTGSILSGRIVAVINDWAKLLDVGGQVDTFILDFEKAFDKPPHKRLKCKLHRYGIKGKLKYGLIHFCAIGNKVL